MLFFQVMMADCVAFFRLPFLKILTILITSVATILVVATYLYYFLLFFSSLDLTLWTVMVLMVFFWGMIIWFFRIIQRAYRGKKGVFD